MVKSVSRKVAHTARTYPNFYSITQLGVDLLPLDGMLVHHSMMPQNLLDPFIHPLHRADPDQCSYQDCSWLVAIFYWSLMYNDSNTSRNRVK